MQLTQLEDLGYDVGVAFEVEDGPTVYRVQGYGVDVQLADNDAAAFASLVDPAAHADRVFQADEPEAAAARGRLLATGHTVTRPDVKVDVFNVAGPVVNEPAAGIADLVATGPMLDAVAETDTTNAATISGEIKQRIDTLEQASKNWGNLTPAQKDAVNHASARGVALLARLQLQQLNATGD